MSWRDTLGVASQVCDAHAHNAHKHEELHISADIADSAERNSIINRFHRTLVSTDPVALLQEAAAFAGVEVTGDALRAEFKADMADIASGVFPLSALVLLVTTVAARRGWRQPPWVVEALAAGQPGDIWRRANHPVNAGEIRAGEAPKDKRLDH
jgi:hypothetical protein